MVELESGGVVVGSVSGYGGDLKLKKSPNIMAMTKNCYEQPESV